MRNETKREIQRKVKIQEARVAGVVNASSALTRTSGKVSAASGYGKGQTIKCSDRPRRNDPCPCGSGAKFKRCCLVRDGDQEVDFGE